MRHSRGHKLQEELNPGVILNASICIFFLSSFTDLNGPRWKQGSLPILCPPTINEEDIYVCSSIYLLTILSHLSFLSIIFLFWLFVVETHILVRVAEEIVTEGSKMVPCYEGSPELAPAGAYTCDLSVSQCLEKWEEGCCTHQVQNKFFLSDFCSPVVPHDSWSLKG